MSKNTVIELAQSGNEALEVITELMNEGFDIPVVICDYIMPGMKGDELLTNIHKISPHTLKIMLTGQAALTGVINAINQANLYKYVEKPWQKEDLRRIISQAIVLYYQNKELSLENNTLLEERTSLEKMVCEKNQELEKSSAKLKTIEKMTTIGQLAENLFLFKEYQNSLSNITANLALLTRLSKAMITRDNDDVTTYLKNEMSLYSMTNAEIEKILIAFRERNTPLFFSATESEQLDLNEYITFCIQQIAGDIKDQISIKSEYGNLPSYCHNQPQIKYILSNLIMIIIDWMNKPGELSITTFFQNNMTVIFIEVLGIELETSVFGSLVDQSEMDDNSLQTVLLLSSIYQLITELSGNISLKCAPPSSIIKFTIELPV